MHVGIIPNPCAVTGNAPEDPENLNPVFDAEALGPGGENADVSSEQADRESARSELESSGTHDRERAEVEMERGAGLAS
jgi:hypothetical protein